MSEYEIGRDLQELRSRIEALEAGFPRPGDRLLARQVGKAASAAEGGVDREKPPIVWTQQKAVEVPTFVHGLLGLSPHLKLSGGASKTWPCHPDPNIFYVNWSGGGTDEYFRLTDQVFSLVRVTDPNTAVTTASYTYSARLKASGKGFSAYSSDGRHWFPYPGESMTVHLRDAGGGILYSHSGSFGVNCGDNYLLVQGPAEFPAGLYDLVSSATWEFQGNFAGSMIARC
jgi:hypothetical protein